VFVHNLFPKHVWSGGRRQAPKSESTKSGMERELSELFSKFGSIRKVFVHPSKPFGFVTFIDQNGVDTLMRRSDSIQYNGYSLRPRRCLTKFQENSPEFTSAPSNWLRIDNVRLPDRDKARKYFNDAIGPVEDIKVREIVQTKQTYALVRFASADSVDKALIIKDHAIFGTQGQIYKVAKSDVPSKSGGGTSHELVQTIPSGKRSRDGQVQPPQKRSKSEAGVALPVRIKQEAGIDFVPLER